MRMVMGCSASPCLLARVSSFVMRSGKYRSASAMASVQVGRATHAILFSRSRLTSRRRPFSRARDSMASFLSASTSAIIRFCVAVMRKSPP